MGASHTMRDCRTTSRTANGRVGVGVEGDWIGLGVGLCLDL